MLKGQRGDTLRSPGRGIRSRLGAMSEDERVIPLPRRRAARKGCPICGAASHRNHHPFCSARCAEVDLGRWLKGTYRIETDEAPGEGEVTPDEEA